MCRRRPLAARLPPGEKRREVVRVDADCRGDADRGKLAALDHRVHRRAADPEALGHLLDGEEALGQDQAALRAPYRHPIRRVSCFVGRDTGWTGSPLTPGDVHCIRDLPRRCHASREPYSRFGTKGSQVQILSPRLSKPCGSLGNHRASCFRPPPPTPSAPRLLHGEQKSPRQAPAALRVQVLAAVEERDRLRLRCRREVHVPLRGADLLVPGQVLDGLRRRAGHRQPRAAPGSLGRVRSPERLHASHGATLRSRLFRPEEQGDHLRRCSQPPPPLAETQSIGYALAASPQRCGWRSSSSSVYQSGPRPGTAPSHHRESARHPRCSW